MTLNNVKSNEPGSNAIRKLMENTRKSYDRATMADFDKNELAHLYGVLGKNRRFVRELSLGHTLSSYANWTHVQANDGMSIWKYPVTNFQNYTLNELYQNDTKFTYEGQATSESTPKSFGAVFITDAKASGETFTDYTGEASSVNGTPFAFGAVTLYTETLSATFVATALTYTNILQGSMSVENSGLTTVYVEDIDFTMEYDTGTISILSSGSIASNAQLVLSYTYADVMYLGDISGTFSTFYNNLATRGVGNSFSYKFWNSATWESFTPTDSTGNFSVTGNVSWSASSLTGWTTTTVNSTSGYFIKILRKVESIISPSWYQLVEADAAITTLLQMSKNDFDTDNYKWAYYNNYVYTSILNIGESNNEGVTWISNTSSTDAKKNFFVYNNTFLTNYRTSASGTGNPQVRLIETTYMDSSTVTYSTTYGADNAIAFPYASNSYIYFKYYHPNTASSQIYFDYFMDEAQSNKVAKFKLEYNVIGDGDDVTPTGYDGTVSGTINTVSTSGINDFITVTGLAIASSDFASATQTVVCKLTRLSGVASGHTGIFYLRNLYVDEVKTLFTESVEITGGGSTVDTVFGRTGSVVAVAGDYSASQVTNDSTYSGTNVDDVLNLLAVRVDQDVRSGSSPTFNLLTISAISGIAIDDIYGYTNSPNGFRTPDDDVTISFNDGTRTLTIAPQSGSYAYWVNGIRYDKTASSSIIIPDTEGTHYIYYNGDTLSQTMTWTNDLIMTYTFIAIIQWDADNNKQIYIGSEFKHGYRMGAGTHKYLHDVFGFRLDDGGGLTDILADENGSLDSHAQFGIEATDAHDEDAEFAHTARLSTDIISVYYKSGASGNFVWRVNETSSFAVLTTGTGRAAYNQLTGGNWVQTEVANNDFVLAHVFTFNDATRKFGVIQGETDYATAITARDGATAEINTLIIDGIIGPETSFLGTLIFQTSNSYSNTVKSIIRTTDTGDDYIDLREYLFTRGGTTGSLTDHGALGGLSDDDHPQYAKRNESVVFTNVTTSGTLTVSGLATLNSGLTVTGQTQLSTTNVTGNVTISGTLTVSGNIVTSGQAYSVLYTDTYASSIVTNCNLGNVHKLTLSGNIVISASNFKAGATYMWMLTQDNTGSRTATFSSGLFKFNGGTAPTLTTTSGALDIVTGVSDGTLIYCTFADNFS